MNTIVKVCLLCSKKLVGRSDKKFCNDACRNEFNNRLNSDENNLMRRINYVLRKNRRILIELLEKNQNSVSKIELIAAGFDFTHCTSVNQTSKGKTTFKVYEMSYVFKNSSMVEIFIDSGQSMETELFNRPAYRYPHAFA